MFSDDQSWVKAYTASVPSCRNLELNLDNLALLLEENLSIESVQAA